MKLLTPRKYAAVNLLLLLFLIAVSFVAINIGPAGATILSDKYAEGLKWNIIFTTRLPRVILAALVGIALASSGVAFQSLLRNPLADPYIIGVSGGAALGCVIGASLSLPFALISAIAFASAFASMLFIYWIARTRGRLPAHTLLLTGVIFNAFAFAVIMLIHSIVTMEQAHEILFLLMGSLEFYSYNTIFIVSAAVAAGFALLIMFSGKMNIMSMGDETAENLGVDIEKFRRLVFFSASLMIGTVVSVSGLIGFVGLFIPHALRIILGPDNRLLVPAAGLAGGAFLIAADTVARTALAGGAYQMQLPVGVITAFIGGPFFVFVLKRQMK